MSEGFTMRKLDRAPEWVLVLFDDIDAKRFGAGFDCFEPDASMIFGASRFEGVDAIKRGLAEFDKAMDTKHAVLEFWDGGPMKLIRGEATLTKAGRKPVTSAFIHIVHMSARDPTRVRALHAAAGPATL